MEGQRARQPEAGADEMRNLFDQYEVPENRLTHALVCTLQEDRSLLRPFLRRIGVRGIPPIKRINIVQQQLPGAPATGNEEESTGLPDACFYDDAGWAVMIEVKIQARCDTGQLDRHARTARRRGYEKPQIVLISANRLTPGAVPEGVRGIEWRQVYAWFRDQQSAWAGKFVEYMRVFESRMIAKNYDVGGTLTMFDGLRFDAENPYNYREGKRLIRLLGDELQKRRDLRRIGIDPEGPRRTAITGSGQDEVWDFLPLTEARGSRQFTAFPHLTMGLKLQCATAAVTVPNGVRGGFRTKLKQAGPEGFRSLISGIEKKLRPIVLRNDAKPVIYALQRHYASQRSRGDVDARLEVDLRTIAGDAGSGVRRQPEWLEAIYEVMCRKRSNLQLGFQVQFPYSHPRIRSTKAVDLFAETWVAMSPLLAWVLGGRRPGIS